MGRRFEKDSQRFSLTIHSEAFSNIRNILHHIGSDKQQPVNALKVFVGLCEVIEKITLNPFAFREAEALPTVNKIYRRANCYSWSIIYRISGTKILVLGVMHQSSKAERIKELRKRK